MNKLNIDYGSFTIKKNEDLKIIKKRVLLNLKSVHKYINLFNFIWIIISTFNLTKAENFTCSLEDQNTKIKKLVSYKSDKAANGLSEICRRAKRDGYKIMISGQGPMKFFLIMDLMELNLIQIVTLVVYFLKILKVFFHGLIFRNTMELYLMKEKWWQSMV